MSYLEFAYPYKKPTASEASGEEAGLSTPPHSEPTETGGRHYYTWRNFTAREILKEKEKDGDLGKLAVKHNPEPIPKKITARYQDQNFIQTIQPLQTFKPRTLSGSVQAHDKKRFELGLKEIVQVACEKGLKVKAVGTGHSFSDIMTTNDFLVITDDLNQILPHTGSFADEEKKQINKELHIKHYPYLREIIRENGYTHFLKLVKAEALDIETIPDENPRPALVEFEAGIKLDALNAALWDKGWALRNLGTYQGQSFIGAVSTSTHGSGINLPPLPDMIKSLVLVADEGKVYRIEPTNGITDPKTGNSEPGIDQLIQDDDCFYSTLVNVGTFGLIYSVIIEAVPRFCLLETIELTTWDNLRVRLMEQNDLMSDATDTHEIFEHKTFVAPNLKYKIAYPDKGIHVGDSFQESQVRQASLLLNSNLYKGVHFCTITRQYEVPYDVAVDNKWFDDKDPGRLLSNDEKKTLSPLLDLLGEKLYEKESNQEILNELKQLLICGAILFATPKKRETPLGNFAFAVDCIRPVLSSLTPGVISAFLPALEKGFDIDRANKALTGPVEPDGSKDEFYLNRSYRVYLKSSDLNGYGIETGFSVARKVGVINSEGKPETVPHYIAAIDKSLAIAEQHWKEGRYIQTATTAIRFVKGSKAYLSPQYGELTCMIEMLNVADTHGGKELFYRYQKEFEKLDGRPHWGLDLSVTTGNNNFWQGRYPKFQTWKENYDFFNSHGTFDNRFTDRMGLSVQPFPIK